MNNNKFKVSFIGYYKNAYNFKDSSCILPISVGQRYHEGEMFEAVINIINNNFKTCHIVVCDSLQRHTLELFDHKTNQDIHAYANQLGEAWINRSMPVITTLEIPYEITRWDDWLLKNDYKEQRIKVDKLYDVNNKFRLAVQNSVHMFLDRCQKRMGDEFDYDKFLPSSIEYFKEECAVMPLWAKKRINFEIYNGKRPDALVVAHQHFVPKDLLVWLNLRFRTKSQNNA
ncbi:MAG: hypothetical protein JXR42_06150 [Gammaproteobacteria bacterium]|nr:hypothetical protein [Gammaproteobacteria bacterium]